MPSLFQAAAADAATANDEWYSENFILEPRTKLDVNGSSVLDVTRPVSPFRGVFVAKGQTLHAHGRNRADSSTTPVSADAPYIRILVNTLPFRPRRDDHVTRVDTGELFALAAELDRQFGGLRMRLTEIRG